MAGQTGKRRVALLFSVLAGLFLMHGLTAAGVGGCHGAAPTAMAMETGQAPEPSHAMHMPALPPQTSPSPQPTASGADSLPDHQHAGETCVPLRPEGLSGLLFALFLFAPAPRLPRLPHAARLIRAYWPHGPPRTGVQVLRTLSISRT